MKIAGIILFLLVLSMPVMAAEKTPPEKDAHWSTVGLHGTEWRLVIMHIRPGQAVSSWKDIGYVNSGKL
jgi:hypothetical protein